MEQKLEYINMGRSGYVVYKDRESELKLYYEFGGGNCVATINVPTREEWTSKTQRPLSDRNKILTFIAEQTIKDQASGSSYELSDNYIEIFKKD